MMAHNSVKNDDGNNAENGTQKIMLPKFFAIRTLVPTQKRENLVLSRIHKGPMSIKHTTDREPKLSPRESRKTQSIRRERMQEKNVRLSKRFLFITMSFRASSLFQ